MGDLNTRKEPLTEKVNGFVVPIRAELNDVRHEAGIVSMARGSEIDSALTSFFIVLGAQPALNGTYTVFGRVVEGMDVVRKIEMVPVQGETPVTRVDVDDAGGPEELESEAIDCPSWPGGVSLALRKRRVSDLMARDGVVAQDQKDLLKLNHHPVRSIKGASRYFS